MVTFINTIRKTTHTHTEHRINSILFCKHLHFGIAGIRGTGIFKAWSETVTE